MRVLKFFLLCLLFTFAQLGEVRASDYGMLISDTAKNPKALPIYDGYTKQETSSTYFVDYSRFWNKQDELQGLGDFTNSGAKNSISYEFASNGLKSEGSKTIAKMSDNKIVNGYWTAENRLCVALPPGAIINPEIYDSLIEDVWSDESEYTDVSGWTKGAPALSYVPGIFDNRYLGMWVDCLLEDGTVLALIVTDTKALHKGYYNGEQCLDSTLDGYAQWRGRNGVCSYKGILEVCISGDYKKSFDANKLTDLNLANNKIVGFRCYAETCGRFY